MADGSNTEIAGKLRLDEVTSSSTSGTLDNLGALDRSPSPGDGAKAGILYRH